MLLGKLGIAILKAAILAAIESIGRRQVAFCVGIRREKKTIEERDECGNICTRVVEDDYPRLRFDFELRSLPPERRHWLDHVASRGEIDAEEILFGDEESTE
jgi:hypothetical protein